MKLPKFLRNSQEDQPESRDADGEDSHSLAENPLEGELPPLLPPADIETYPSTPALAEEGEAQEKQPTEPDGPGGWQITTPPKKTAVPPEPPPVVEATPLEPFPEVSENPVEEELVTPESDEERLPPTEDLPETEVPAHPPWPRRFVRWLFDKDTPVGSTMRLVAMFAGVFGLGLLFAWLVWIQPQSDRAEALVAERDQVKMELSAGEDDRLSMQRDLKDARRELADAQDDALRLEARVHLAKAAYWAAKAQQAIVEKQGADALKAIDSAKLEAAAMNRYLAPEDPDVAAEIEARLTAAKSALVRDAALASSDLDTLITLLMQQDKILMAK